MLSCCQEDASTKQEETIAPVSSLSTAEVSKVTDTPAPSREEQAVVESPPAPQPEAAPAKEVGSANVVITLERKSGTSLGFKMDKTDSKNLCVQSVDETGVLKVTCDAAKKEVKPGFRLVRVNKTTGEADELIKMISEPGMLELEFEAYSERVLTVEKGEKKLGTGLKLGKGGVWIAISQIDESGVIPELNKSAAPEAKVQEHDKIVMVDAEGSSAEKMLSLIKEKPSFTLKIWSWASLRT
eukprot:TRINITY_DN93722_c0_g1_i1.p1 TRINITY_DN93722_c0_g1~~TRINITY_DN93722_c0_g1_i1.p1  ORF type:complete len:241 (+),score=54.65 TRINITY_DN93722_c0_g1_i1:47-769(+)